MCTCVSLLTGLLLALPPRLLLLPQSVLLTEGSTLLVPRNNAAMERTLGDEHTYYVEQKQIGMSLESLCVCPVTL